MLCACLSEPGSFARQAGHVRSQTPPCAPLLFVRTQGPSSALLTLAVPARAICLQPPKFDLSGPGLVREKNFRGGASGLGPRSPPQFCRGSELDLSPMPPQTVPCCVLPGSQQSRTSLALMSPTWQGLLYPACLWGPMCSRYRPRPTWPPIPQRCEDPRNRRRYLDWPHCLVLLRNVPGTPYHIGVWLSNHHRSVTLTALLAEFLVRQGLQLSIRHLCDRQWDYLYRGDPQCQACNFNSRSDRWKNSYDYFADLMLRQAWARGYHNRPWWQYFGLPAIPPGGLQPMLTMLPPVVPAMEEDAAPPGRGRGVWDFSQDSRKP